MRRIVSLVLAAILILCTPVMCNALFTDDDVFRYEVLPDGTLEIAGCLLQKPEIVVPSEINGIPVTSIGFMVFCGMSYVNTVVIPETVINLGDYVFSGSDSIQNIFVDDNNPVFCDIDGAVYTKDASEIIACPPGRTSYSVEEGTERIDKEAFIGRQRLVTLNIPASVTEIDTEGFIDCSSLQEITVDKDNPVYADVDGILCDKAITSVLRCPRGKTECTLPDSVIRVVDKAFSNCTSLKSVTLPEGIAYIGDRAFEACVSLTDVTFPKTLVSIGKEAFYNCSKITELSIPDSVISIGDRAFSDCYSLADVTIGAAKIGEKAFYSCHSLRNLKMKDGVNCIGKYAFEDCWSFRFVTFPETVTTIETGAFHKCTNLRYVRIPDGVTSISDEVFYECSKLENAVISENTTKIGKNAFGQCRSLYCVTIPSGVKTIGSSAFENCEKLKGVSIPDTVTSIGDSAFASCFSLTSVRIPKNVTSIGKEAFEFCMDLKNAAFLCRNTYIQNKAFMYTSVSFYGYENSTASDYARDNSIDFNMIEDKAIVNAAEVDFYIEALGDTPKLDKRADVKYARELYDSLADSEKVLVSGYSMLLFHEEIIEKLEKMGDINSDGAVNVSDIISLKALIMSDSWTHNHLMIGDMNFDNTLDVSDMISIKNVIMSAN